MPAAVLFATVFTVGAMGRHSELTAAKAGGHELLPADGADLRGLGDGDRCSRSWWARWRRGPPRASSRSRRPSRPGRTRVALQLRLSRRRGVGLHGPLARRRARASSSSCCSSARATARPYPGLIITADSATLRRSAAALAREARHQPGDRGPEPAGRASPSASMRLRALTQSPRRPAGRAQGARRDALRGAGPVHRRAQALGQRREQADRGAGAQARAAGHLPHHRPVRRAARGAGAARRRRGRRRDQPGHDDPLPADHPDHEGGRRRRRDRPHAGRVAAEPASFSLRGAGSLARVRT